MNGELAPWIIQGGFRTPRSPEVILPIQPLRPSNSSSIASQPPPLSAVVVLHLLSDQAAQSRMLVASWNRLSFSPLRQLLNDSIIVLPFGSFSGNGIRLAEAARGRYQ